MEEIDFEICHSGNLPPMEWYALAGSGVQHQRAAAVDEQRSKLGGHSKLGAFRTVRIRNWGLNRAIKTNQLVLLSVTHH